VGEGFDADVDVDLVVDVDLDVARRRGGRRSTTMSTLPCHVFVHAHVDDYDHDDEPRKRTTKPSTASSHVGRAPSAREEPLPEVLRRR